MNDERGNDIVINIPKPRVYSKGLFYSAKKTKRPTHKTIRNPSQASLSKYTLLNTRSIPIESIKKDELLLSYNVYAKQQERKSHELRLTIDVYDKYKVAYTELKNRLHIENSEDFIFTITDIDKDFFKCIETHKLSTYAPLFKSLKTVFNQYLRLKKGIGYLNDHILNIEILQRKEKEIYDRSLESYKQQVKYLDEFISNDYKKSIACLNECDTLAYEVNKKESELIHLATEKFTIVSRLISLDYLYGIQQKYGRYLYYLSPRSWRLSHRDFARSIEIEAKGFDFSCSTEEDTFNVIFNKMRNECCIGRIKPALYFQKPRDLLDVFEGIEKQQLYHFAHINRVEPHIKSLRKSIHVFKDNIAQECYVVLNIIKRFENSLQFYNDRCSDMKENFFKILHGAFYKTVAVAQVLQLKLHLEFSCEKVHVDKLWQMDIMTTTKALENMYMDYSKKLDEVHNEKLKRAVVQHIDLERHKMRVAKIATQKLLLYRILQRNLFRAHGLIEQPPTVQKKQKAKKTFDQKWKRPRSKPKLYEYNIKVLSDTEREYLTLFTDWTQNDNPANYLQSFSIARVENA